jgi:monomeric sarcosine oxidase
MAIWDAIVIGAGGVGSAAAMHLAKSGARVLGIDQYQPAHDRGSSHGQTRIIRQAYFEHPSYVPLLRRAYELWDELEQNSNRKLFHRTGLVELGPIDGVVIPGVLRSAKTYSLPIETLLPAEVTERWPGIRGNHDWQAVIEKNAGFLKVEECVQTHLDLARQFGCKLMHNCKVHQWKAGPRGVKVVTDQGSEQAAHLLVAGGPWSQTLVPALSGKLRVLRKHLYWFEPERSGFEETDGFPCFFHETSNGFFYGFPSLNGSGVKVARHSGGQPIEQPDNDAAADDFDDTDMQDQQLVSDYVREYLPGLGNRLLKRAKCYYTSTPDEHFVIDHLPDQSNVTIVAGLSGHGFKFTSVLGEIASQLAQGTKSTLDIGPFGIARF